MTRRRLALSLAAIVFVGRLVVGLWTGVLSRPGALVWRAFCEVVGLVRLGVAHEGYVWLGAVVVAVVIAVLWLVLLFRRNIVVSAKAEWKLEAKRRGK